MKLRAKRAPNFPRPILVNKGKYVKLPREEYEAIMRTLDYLSSPKAMKQIREAKEAVKKGRVRPWEEVKKELKL